MRSQGGFFSYHVRCLSREKVRIRLHQKQKQKKGQQRWPFPFSSYLKNSAAFLERYSVLGVNHATGVVIQVVVLASKLAILVQYRILVGQVACANLD